MEKPPPHSTEHPQLVTVTPNGESIPGGGTMTKEVAEQFFATRGDSIEKAVEDVKRAQVKTGVDGEYLGRWVLTQISYWNTDKERLVLLCEKAIIICKYNFVAMKLLSVQRIQLPNIKEIRSGRFQYPENSLCVSRLYEGLRISWGSFANRPWFEKWNPLETDIPQTTFASHPVFSLPDLNSSEVYNVKSFLSALRQVSVNFSGITFLDDRPIIIESYAGFISYVHNQSKLGFSKERGGVSF